MTLRPRYSLLTLLLLTALVAGGVKLWYGPHHVVEMQAMGWEAEFTYTRDWRGRRIVDGPVVYRQYDYWEKSVPSVFCVRYFRQGVDTDWMYCWYVHFGERSRFLEPIWLDERVMCPLSAQERLAFDRARDKVLLPLQKFLDDLAVERTGMTLEEELRMSIDKDSWLPEERQREFIESQRYGDLHFEGESQDKRFSLGGL